MALVVLLKFFHYLALFLAGGLGVGAAIIQTAHRKAGTAPAPTVQTAMHMLARLGLVSIIILWGTGIWLAYSIYGGMGIGWAFHIKLLGATGLLLAITGLKMRMTTMTRAKMMMMIARV